MPDLVSFAKRLKEELARVNREPHWGPIEAEKYMADVSVRWQLFADVTARLRTNIIQPRLEILAGYFANAGTTKNEPENRCSYWFGYSERFPATTKVAIAVEHDIRFENVIVGYDACMTPLYIKFNEHDKLTLPMEDIKDEVVESWVEKRLLEFLAAYLQIDRGGDDFSDEAVTDPVYGMRINRSSAAAGDSFCGHPYFFCSRECRESFVHDPRAYVEVEPI